MRNRIKRFFAPPVFEGDEDKTRRARLLNAVLLLCAVGMGLMLTVDIISGDIPFRILGIEVAAIAALLWLRLPMHRGRIIQASYGPLLLFLILTTAAVYFMGTTRDPALGAFILLVVTAGLLLDRRAIFVTTAACILAVSILMAAERAGRLPAPNLTVALSQWGTITVLLVVSAYLTFWSRESIERSLDLARRELAVRRAAEGALRESEEKYRKLVDYTLVGKYIHQDRIFMFCNKRFAEIFGYEGPGEIIGRNIQDFIAPASGEKVAQEIEYRESGEKEFSHYEFQGVRKDGSLIYVEVLGSRIDYRTRLAIQGSVLDVTERRKAEDRLQASLREKEVLLQEIHHRVKNNMQVISSLLNLQSKHLTDPVAVEMFRECQHRIRTMALVHESLYKSSDLSKIEFGSYLRSLASHLLHFNEVDTRRIRLETALEEVYLDIQTAIPSGLIANELLSNAMKHAFPGKRSGTIELALRPLPEGSYLLSVKDDGIGFPEGIDARKTESLGLQIVSSLIDQVDGRLEILREKGTEFRIVFQPPCYPRRGSGQEM